MLPPGGPEGAGPTGTPPSDLERAAGRYLLAVHRLSDRSKRRVSTGELSEYLDVSAASVTEMVGKLDARGLADHERYRGVELTDAGRAVARRLAWRFCVVTNFFESVLDTDLAEGEPYDIGHTIPADGLVRLRELVDHPCVEVCPEIEQNYEGCLL